MRIPSILLALLSLLPVTASSQTDWQRQLTPFGNQSYSQSYFVNERIGFHYESIWTVGYPFVRTTNDGVHWLPVIHRDSMDGAIVEMYFDSVHHGYAVVNNHAPGNAYPEFQYKLDRGRGLFETRDTGRTWKKISPHESKPNYLNISRVYAIGKRIFTNAVISEDGGKSWSPSPWKDLTTLGIRGTREGLIIVAAVSPRPEERSIIFQSTDYGRTWSGYDSPQIAFRLGGNFYIHPESGRLVAITYQRSTGYVDQPEGYPELYSYIKISPDTGRSWSTKYQTYLGLNGKYLIPGSNGVDSGAVIYTLAGSACAIYVGVLGEDTAWDSRPDTTLGLLRSTDLGETWKNVEGPFHYRDVDEFTIDGAFWENHFGVFGNGAVVRGLGWEKDWFKPNNAYLYKTSTGGDGILSPNVKPEELAISRQLFSSTSIGLSSPDTLHSRLCDSASLALFFSHSGECRLARLQDIRLEGISQNEVLTRTIIRDYNDGLRDSAEATIYPTVAGTYNVKLRVTYEFSALDRQDTLLPFVLVVHPNPSTLQIQAKDTIDLGTQSLCNAMTVTDSIALWAVGCDPLTLKSVRFEPSAGSTGYTFASVSNATLVPNKLPQYYTLAFKPIASGVFTGLLIIDGPDNSDTVFVLASAVEDGRQMIAHADTFRSTMCMLTEGEITLTNTSCRLMTLDGLDIPAPLELLPNQLPLGIPAGKSVQLRVRFTPVTEGPQRVDALAHLRFVGQNETIEYDTILPLNVIGMPGTPLTVTTDTTINIGDVSVCSDKSFVVPIPSLGCDTLSITSATLSASDKGYSITTMPAPFVPVNESTSATLLFTPPSTLGAFTTDLIIATNAGTRKVTLIANVVAGTKVLASSTNTINFGETNICEERDSVIRLTNTGCDTLTITAADVDNNFNVGGSYPIVLAPNESIDLPITTIVDTAGKPTVLLGTLSITSTADNQIAPSTLTRRLYYPTKLRIEAVNETSGTQGAVVKFRVLLEGDVPATMTALHFDFLHNGDLLSWDQYDGAGLSRTAMTGNEQQRTSFTLSPVHDGQIAEFSFKTNLAIAEQTTLSFDNISFDAAGVTFAPECIAVISDSGSRFNYIYTCGDNIIRDRLNGTRLIKSITPNPAKDEIRVELAQGIAEAEITITDVLGKIALHVNWTDRINVGALLPGTYYLRVVTNTASQTRSFVVSR